MRYIAEIEYYPNCPTCDGGYPSKLEFFDSIRDMLTYSLSNLNEYGIREVYRVNFKTKTANIITELGPMRIDYEYGRHRYTGIIFKCKGLKIRTMDNGSGTTVWKRES